MYPRDRHHQLLLPQLLLSDPAGSLDRVVVGAGSDPHALLGEHAANRLDPPAQPIHRPAIGVTADKRDHYRSGRSSSAAKKPAAALRISLARRNSRFSARNLRTSADSWLVTPGRWPASTSALRIHLRSVSVDPIPSFVATDSIAAHSDSY